MKNIIEDSHKITAMLQERGFAKKKAEAVVKALESVDVSDLASKKDLKELELRMVKWSIGIQVAQTGVTIAAVFGLLQFNFS